MIPPNRNDNSNSCQSHLQLLRSDLLYNNITMQGIQRIGLQLDADDVLKLCVGFDNQWSDTHPAPDKTALANTELKTENNSQLVA